MTIHLYKRHDNKLTLIQIWYDPHVRSWFGQYCKPDSSIEQACKFHTVRSLRRKFDPFHVNQFELVDDGTETVVEHKRETVESHFGLNKNDHYVGKLKNKSLSEIYS